MYNVGDLIDGKYIVTSLCSNSGGMGTIFHVNSVLKTHQFKIVLKVCNKQDIESLIRFKREVRIMKDFSGNNKIAEILDSNTEYDPPYFVMKYYEDGDLNCYAKNINFISEEFESLILSMADALSELHQKSVFHRDIKPQNFLVDGKNVVISDFGLSAEVSSPTAFTNTLAYGGTYDFMPPEYYNGGFKNMTAESDIFMIGKTIYSIITGDNPRFMQQSKIPSPIYNIITKCCNNDKSLRYSDIASLKQDIVSAYNVVLKRGGQAVSVYTLMTKIKDQLNDNNTYDPKQVISFIEKLRLLDDDEKIKNLSSLSSFFLGLFAVEPLQHKILEFLESYEVFVESQNYNWNYAETIASGMRRIFISDFSSNTVKAKALELAIKAAIYMNRFAAMETCENMMYSVDDDQLGWEVAVLIEKYYGSFIDKMEAVNCKNLAVACAIQNNQVKLNNSRDTTISKSLNENLFE